MNWLKSFWKKLQQPAPRKEILDESMTNFTPRAHRVLNLAQMEARRFNHNFVGAEHLLLGLVKEGHGVAANVLKNFGLDLDNVRLEVEKRVGRGDSVISETIPLTPRVREILKLAQVEAKNLRHTYIGTEHLLLGLLRENKSVAAHMLKHFNVSVEQTRKEVLKELDPYYPPPEEGQKS